MKSFCYKVLRALSVLLYFYKQGHQLTQMAPGMIPSGRRLEAQYLRSQNKECFDRSGTQHDDGKNRANTFRGWMSDTVEAFHGIEWKCTGWHASILVCAEREHCFAAYTDCYEKSNRQFLLVSGGMSELLIRPAGDVEEEWSE